IFSLWVDFLLLKIPFVKNMIFYNEFCTFFLVFSLLLKNKVDFLTAFFLASSSLKNKFLCKKCKHISTLCQQGLSPDEAFKKSHLFEGVVLSMLNIAMKSAKLDLMSEKISNFYETKQENLMSKFIFLLEPLMTFLVAIL
ncbi:type II secretion system F family protein, partial [Campylobacter taeniopygiae]